MKNKQRFKRIGNGLAARRLYRVISIRVRPPVMSIFGNQYWHDGCWSQG